MPHAFERALERAKNVDLMLNHERKIGSTTEGNLELFEDAIGPVSYTHLDVYKRQPMTERESVRRRILKMLFRTSAGSVKSGGSARWRRAGSVL